MEPTKAELIAMASYAPPSSLDLRVKAFEFLRDCKPKQFKAMVKDKSLKDVLDARVKACQEYAASLIATGVWEGEAWNLAIRRELLESESD